MEKTPERGQPLVQARTRHWEFPYPPGVRRPADLTAPPSAITPTTVLIWTVLPSAILTSLSTPLAGEGISASTLSVEISKRGSSRCTVSPGFFNHLVMVPSKIDSPIWGMITSVGMEYPFAISRRPVSLTRTPYSIFDRVNHDKLMGQVAKRVEDKRLLKLIRAFLNAGVMENGLVSPSVEGTPQGGPLSPLLSNLVLDELDRELERRGHRYVRYADDCNIYVRSERAGQRVMKSITKFITQKLKLKVNESKSAVARPQERKFLGFTFTDGPEVKRAIAPKSLVRFKRRVREITRRAKGVSMETTMEELAPYLRGWRSYFGFCETPRVLGSLTCWVRARLRVALWRQWKTTRRRRAALLALGVRPKLASNTAGSSRGPWYIAHAKALSVALPTAYFKSLGLPNLEDAN